MRDMEWLWPHIVEQSQRLRCEPSVADDAMQDCVVRYLEACERRSIARPRAYVAQVLRTCIADQYRRRNRGVPAMVIREDDQPVAASLVQVSRDPADVVCVRVDVREAIAKLPKRQRFAARCYYIEGASTLAIAESLQMCESSVCRTLSRARASLRKLGLGDTTEGGGE